MSEHQTRFRLRDHVIVRNGRTVIGKAEVVRRHRDGTISVVWSESYSTLDGLVNQMFNPANRTRYVSRVEITACELIGEQALAEAARIVSAAAVT